MSSRFDALRAITRRHFRIDYRSPFICLRAEEASGTGSSESSTLDILPTFQEAGPGLTAEVIGGTVSLSWTAVVNGFAYVVYRATAVDGPYVRIISGIVDRLYVDSTVVPGTYFYKVTGIEPNFGETLPSNIVSVTV
jgi:hypothetical protein